MLSATTICYINPCSFFSNIILQERAIFSVTVLCLAIRTLMMAFEFYCERLHQRHCSQTKATFKKDTTKTYGHRFKREHKDF